MPARKDSIRTTTVSTGTGNLTLSGVGPDGFTSPLTAFAAYVRFEYSVRLGTERESGIGYHNGTALVREFPKEGSAGDATLVNFSSGTKDVFCGPISAVVSAMSPGRAYARSHR